MAGGEGKRLAPYTHVLPKPLLPLGDRPVVEVLLRHLQRHGIREVIMAVNHLSHLIQAFFGDGKNFGLSITYLMENQPLGTCGPLANAMGDLGDQFLVANGDLLTNMNISHLIEFHKNRKADVSVATIRRDVNISLGVLQVGETGRITRYDEKPVITYQASMGLYVFERATVLPHLKSGERLDMPCLLEKMIAADKNIQAFQEECLWLDIGQPEDYEQAQALFASNPDVF